MPCLQIRVSIQLTDAQKDEAIKELSKMTASMIGKPEDYVMVILQDNVPMSMAGSRDPCCFMDLRSIGRIGKSENKKYSQQLTGWWSQHHKISPQRVYISFSNAAGENWGYGGDTFA